ADEARSAPDQSSEESKAWNWSYEAEPLTSRAQTEKRYVPGWVEVQVKVLLLPYGCTSSQLPRANLSQNSNCGLVQPLAVAVTVTVVPAGWGVPGPGVAVMPVQGVTGSV